MLSSLAVRNLAVASECSIDFGPGMTVLTGETGAGKSVLISAIGLVLGARADASRVRSGTREAMVVAEFNLAGNPAACNAMAAQGLEYEGQCLIRRQVSADGRSRAFINDTPVTLKALTAVTRHLVAIHGQHAHYELAGRDAQRTLLDAYGDYPDTLAAVANAATAVQAAEAALRALTEGAGASPDREAFLRFQIAELAPVALTEEAWHALDARHKTLTHAAELTEGLGMALTALEDNDALTEATARLKPLTRFAPELESTLNMLADAEAIIADARHTLRHTADSLDADPAHLSEVDAQLGEVVELARKHRVAPEALAEHLTKLEAELAQIENLEGEVAQRRTALAAAESAYARCAAELSAAREAAAARLGPEVSARIRDLGMPEGRLEIALSPRASERPSPSGVEDVEFMVTTNAGQPVQPLGRVASGGELSRISLAIQTATAALSGVPVLIYDEVDTGISGGVAELVGRRLRETARHRQVFCVTHLPQVASLAAQHLKVRKSSADGQTEVHVDALDDAARVEELARMLSGMEVSDRSREAAAELLARAASR